MKYFLLSFLVLFHVQFAQANQADCSKPYLDQIKNLEGRMNTPRGSLIASTVGEGALIATLVALTGTVSATAVLALPAAAVGAAAYYTALNVERNGLRNGMHVLAEAHKGKGKTLDRFLKILNKKTDNQLMRDDVVNFLVQNDFDNTFCKQNEVTDRYKLMSFRKLLRYTKKELTNVDDASLETDMEIAE